MKKVKKITPIKSATLCLDKCKYEWGKNSCASISCKDCKVHTDEHCGCAIIKNGQPCPYFERFEEGAT